MTEPTIPGPDPDTRAPRLAAPPGSADCHFHIFGPEDQYPYAPKRGYTPPDALEADYARMAGTLGLERGVVVQASAHGADNSRVVDAIAALGPGYRGVGVVTPETPEAEMEELTRQGLRASRMNLHAGGSGGMDTLEDLAAKAANFGWHLQLFSDCRDLAEIAPRLAALPVDLVVDHMGFISAEHGPEHPGFGALLDLARSGKAWVKLTGAERITVEGPPYRDALPYARALIEAAPDRVIWGTDWPHTRVRPPMPNDADLLDLLLEWAPEESLRRKILVDNPKALYGFED